MGTDVVFPIQAVLANDFPFFSDKPNLLQLVSSFLVQAMLPEGFPFHQFNITYYRWCLVPVWRL